MVVILKVTTGMSETTWKMLIGHMLRSCILASGNQFCRNVDTDAWIYMCSGAAALLVINIGHTLLPSNGGISKISNEMYVVGKKTEVDLYLH